MAYKLAQILNMCLYIYVNKLISFNFFNYVINSSWDLIVY